MKKDNCSVPGMVCPNISRSQMPSLVFSNWNSSPPHPHSVSRSSPTLMGASRQFECNPLGPHPSPPDCQLHSDLLPRAPLPSWVLSGFLNPTCLKLKGLLWLPLSFSPKPPGPAKPTSLYPRTRSLSPTHCHLWKYSPFLSPSTSCGNLSTRRDVQAATLLQLLHFICRWSPPRAPPWCSSQVYQALRQAATQPSIFMSDLVLISMSLSKPVCSMLLFFHGESWRVLVLTLTPTPLPPLHPQFPVYLRSASGLHTATYSVPCRLHDAANFTIFTEMRSLGSLFRRAVLPLLVWRSRSSVRLWTEGSWVQLQSRAGL